MHLLNARVIQESYNLFYRNLVSQVFIAVPSLRISLEIGSIEYSVFSGKFGECFLFCFANTCCFLIQKMPLIASLYLQARMRKDFEHLHENLQKKLMPSHKGIKQF